MTVTAHDTIPAMRGHWRLDVYSGDVERDADGRILNDLLRTIEGDNLIVTTGKRLVMDRTFGLGGVGAITHMGVGASATAAAVGDTQLNTTPTLKAFDATPTRSNQTVTAVTTFGTGDANINWQELALFNGSVNGTSVMLNRIAPIGPFSKTSAVSIVVTVTVTQS